GIGGVDRKQVYRLRKQRVGHLFERRELDEPQAAAVRRDDEIALRERDRQALDGDVGKILAEPPPAPAPVERHVNTARRADPQEALIHRVFEDGEAAAVLRQSLTNLHPGLAEILGA